MVTSRVFWISLGRGAWAKSPLPVRKSLQSSCAMSYTEKQGPYLSFIYYYTRLNGRPPAEADMQRYFRVTPPSVHQMVVTLELNGFIERIPGQGRSIRLLI